jgi:hypothetical protein
MANDNHPTRLLVSLCNFAVDGETSLVVVTLPEGSIRPLTEFSKGVGTTGICRFGPSILVAYQLQAGRIAVLDPKNLSIISELDLTDCADPHSIAAFREGIAVASTGSDEILYYPFDGSTIGRAERLFAYGDERTDNHHLNGIAAAGEHLVWCGFGAREQSQTSPSGLRWGNARSGFLQELGRPESTASGLAHPHTVRIFDGTTYLCESSLGSLRTTERTVAVLDGYTRGIEFIGAGRVVVGTSVGRRKSRSTGRILNPLDEGVDAGTCALHVVDIESAETIQTISLDHYAREIYDIFAL